MNPTPHPRLRSDLQWTLHHFADGLSYSVLDPRNGSSYQLGPAEYALVTMLDGDSSVEQASAATMQLAEQTGDDLGIDEVEANQIVQWLMSMGLVTSGDRQSTPPIPERQLRGTRWSAITVKMPLGDPTSIVDTLHRWFRPFASKLSLWIAVGMIALALFQVITNLSRWNEALRPLSDPAAWWMVGIVALLLRILHESAHAVVAKRFGVPVDEIGILWILLVPLPYLDVSRSWQRNRRRERIAIAAAGMISELVVAALAVLIFTWSRSEWTQHIAATVAVTASAVTVLFNANVLMRFDGYHILVDLIGFPNLYGDAARQLRESTARIILGKQSRRADLPVGPLGWFIRLYAVAAAAWRVLVIVGLIVAAEHLLGGLGIVLALAAVLGIVGRAVVNLPKIFRGAPVGRAMAGVTVCALALIGLWWMPTPHGQTDTGVAQYRNPSIVRAPASGFVRELFVQRGERVKQGQLLAKVENVRLEYQTNLTRIQRREAELKYRQLLAEQQLASLSAQWSALKQLDEQLRERQQQVDGLMIRAATDGVIDAPEELSRWVGRYVPEGTPLLRVVNEQDKEIVMLVNQDDREGWNQNKHRVVNVSCPMVRWSTDAKVDYVAPRASDQLSDQSLYGHRQTLGSHLGGPLAVRPTRSDNSHRLLEPRVEVKLQPMDPSQLRDGQRVWIQNVSKRPTIGGVASQTVIEWLDARVARHSLLRQWTSL